MNHSTIIRGKNLVQQKGNQTLLEVRDIQIYSGEVLGCIGPNGAGKSTLLKMLSLLEKPYSGEISFKGNTVYPGGMEQQLRREISVVFQSAQMFDMSVEKNIGLGLSFRQEKKSFLREQVAYWMEIFQIAHLAKKNARALSGGEKQRVALARALVYQPSILFLDEPFSALDLPTKRKLIHDVKKVIDEENITVFFISHDYQEIEFLCDHVMIIDKKQNFPKCKPSEILSIELPPDTKQFIKEWTRPLKENI
ncbi:ATP-binding cassette domain-containing protein [Bacillaceae bacterium S4-13-58]